MTSEGKRRENIKVGRYMKKTGARNIRNRLSTGRGGVERTEGAKNERRGRGEKGGGRGGGEGGE